MRTLYIECSSGASGDMLSAALVALIEDKEKFINKMNALGLNGVKFSVSAAEKCGIKCLSARVEINGEEETERHEETRHEHHEHHGHHEHRRLEDIEHVVDGLNMSVRVKETVKNVYRLLAEAEGKAHGKEPGEIHFHEVGTLDAIADISAVSLLMDELSPDEVIVSPVNVGGGSVRCAHGVLPVPAPATAELLKGVPVYSGSSEGEMCTPTGAALLKFFATSFGSMPAMSVFSTGYGAGKKDFEKANVVRTFLGERDAQSEDTVEVSFNVDDMAGEDVAFAVEKLFEAGAKDVTTEAVGMKKSRPGIKVSVICGKVEKEAVLKTIFKYTTTIGIRETILHRYVMDRSVATIHTPYGNVRKKISCGFGERKEKYEYEDIARIARERDISLKEAREIVSEIENGKKE